MLESLRVTALGSKQSLPPGFPQNPLYVNQADSCTPIAFGASYMNIPYHFLISDGLYWKPAKRNSRGRGKSDHPKIQT